MNTRLPETEELLKSYPINSFTLDTKLYSSRVIELNQSDVMAFNTENEMILLIISSGYIEIRHNDSILNAKSGDLWLPRIGYNEFKVSANCENATIIYIRIKSDMLLQIFNRYSHIIEGHIDPQSFQLNTVLCNDNFVLKSCVNTKCSIEAIKHTVSSSDVEMVILKLEELILIKLKESEGRDLAKRLNLINKRFFDNTFRMFIEDNYTKHWTIAEFAANLDMSTTAFKKIFYQVFGSKHPKSWLNERRLNLADEELRQTNKKVFDIAIECGFTSHSYFSQLYKSYFGYPPSITRR